MRLPMRISASGAVPCCAGAASGASRAALMMDAESRFLFRIFLDCQSECTAAKLPPPYRFYSEFWPELMRKHEGVRAISSRIAVEPAGLTLPADLWQNPQRLPAPSRDPHASTQTACLRNPEPACGPASR